MLQPIIGEIPNTLWRNAASSEHRLLILDYDGTLAPFRTDPRQAVPLGPSIAMLRKIIAGSRTSVAVVSGRPVRELEALLGPLDIILVGENGWEERAKDGDLVRHAPAPADLNSLRRAAAAVAWRSWGWRLERKRASLMLHTRGLPSSEAHELERACEDLWKREITTSGLRLLHVSGGLELDAPGRHKGTAARELINRSTFMTFAVYVGDDESDEDAFREVSGSGFGIRVGAPDLPSNAKGRLSSWLDLPLFLKEWLAIVENRDVPLGMTA